MLELIVIIYLILAVLAVFGYWWAWAILISVVVLFMGSGIYILVKYRKKDDDYQSWQH